MARGLKKDALRGLLEPLGWEPTAERGVPAAVAILHEGKGVGELAQRLWELCASAEDGYSHWTATGGRHAGHQHVAMLTSIAVHMPGADTEERVGSSAALATKDHPLSHHCLTSLPHCLTC